MRNLSQNYYCAEAQDVHRQVSELSESEFVRQFRHPFILWEQASADRTLVFGVCKSSRNQFKQMVTIGRASNNDIVIREDAISELHAYLSWDPEMNRHRLTDAGSPYGTEVANWPVCAHESTWVNSGDKINLGGVKLKYLSAEDFYHYLLEFKRLSTPA